MSDGLRNSLSGEEDLVFSASPNATNFDVKELPGRGIGDVSRTSVCGLGDTRTSKGRGVLPDLDASPCSKACVELCACVPA